MRDKSSDRCLHGDVERAMADVSRNARGMQRKEIWAETNYLSHLYSSSSFFLTGPLHY